MTSRIKLDIDDCWNQIGVWKKTGEVCPKLAEIRHCQHCDTFINAGLDMLDRDLADDYIAENTKIYALEKEQEDNTLISALFFRIAKEWYAIKTNLLKEIIEVTDIHSIPHQQHEKIMGLVNVRGEIELCIALNSMLSVDIESIEKNNQVNKQERMVVIHLDSGKYVFLVDELMGIFRINEREVKQTPTSIVHTKQQLISGIFDYEQKHIGLIDEKLLIKILIGNFY